MALSGRDTCSGRRPPADSPRVKRLILEYWLHAKQYYRKNGKPTSQLVMIKGALRLLREHYAELPAAEFDVIRLQALREVLVREGLTLVLALTDVSTVSVVYSSGESRRSWCRLRYTRN